MIMASAVENDEQEGIRLLLKKINEAWVKGGTILKSSDFYFFAIKKPDDLVTISFQ